MDIVTPSETSEEPAGSGPRAWPDLGLRPRRTDQVSVREEPEEDNTRILYESAAERVFMINDTGRVVLDLCDGSRTGLEVVDEVRLRFESPANVSVEDAVREFLYVLVAANIVVMK